jgi:hypothetical protein
MQGMPVHQNKTRQRMRQLAKLPRALSSTERSEKTSIPQQATETTIRTSEVEWQWRLTRLRRWLSRFLDCISAERLPSKAVVADIRRPTDGTQGPLHVRYTTLSASPLLSTNLSRSPPEMRCSLRAVSPFSQCARSRYFLTSEFSARTAAASLGICVGSNSHAPSCL